MDGFKEIALSSYNRVGPHMNSESVTTCTRPTHAQDRQNFDGEEGETGTKSHLREENTYKWWHLGKFSLLDYYKFL